MWFTFVYVSRIHESYKLTCLIKLYFKTWKIFYTIYQITHLYAVQRKEGNTKGFTFFQLLFLKDSQATETCSGITSLSANGSPYLNTSCPHFFILS